MNPLDRLIDILQFKREVMNQVPLVSTLLAAIAMTAAAALIAAPERGTLRSSLLVAFTSATLLFIFATVLDASILPAMKRPGTLQNAHQIQGLLNLSQVVVWVLLLGILILFAAIGGLGFTYSRRIGIYIFFAGQATDFYAGS